MAASVFEFDRALVREPAESAVNGLRAVDRGAPEIAGLKAEHAAYVDALTVCGVTVERLAADEAFADSMFVEDPALVFGEGAILLRPGAASRLGEAAAILPELRARFATVLTLPETGFADGGDVLVTPDTVYIGLSARTDETGAEHLVAALRDLGRNGEIVTPPEGVLHLKTACSLLDAETLLVTEAMQNADLFAGMRTLVVPDGEEAAANALRVNDTVLIAKGSSRTAELLDGAGYTVREVALDEVMKLDAGLSCMSLRWRSERR
ncbi:dimethylarginine dimethylaminohydrolase family protein [Pararhizobium mangrovi]|uniref:Dimethylarginine dimethylaminohydrolase n=1 Tax=Pararhizobium mangrovi TaxID=2590452 RepID=A0A506U1W9_9HYPH|nr:arginine deiminase family protein [Pararhizobium mangrovi]TPW27446.1 dimethylarginine dimethylaminohydrolase [Pararhizobium mangrovi]